MPYLTGAECPECQHHNEPLEYTKGGTEALFICDYCGTEFKQDVPEDHTAALAGA